MNWHTTKRILRVIWLPMLLGYGLFLEKSRPASSRKVGYNCFVRVVLQCLDNLPQFIQEISPYAQDADTPHVVRTCMQALHDMHAGNDLSRSQLHAVWKAILTEILLMREAAPAYDAAYFFPEFISCFPKEMLRICDTYFGIEMKHRQFCLQTGDAPQTCIDREPMLWLTPQDNTTLSNLLDSRFGHTYTQDGTQGEIRRISRMPPYVAIGFSPPDMPIEALHIPETLTFVHVHNTTPFGIKSLDPETQPACRRYELIAIASYIGPCKPSICDDIDDDEELYGYDSYVNKYGRWWGTSDIHHFGKKSHIVPEKPPSVWRSRTTGLPFLMIYQEVTTSTHKAQETE